MMDFRNPCRDDLATRRASIYAVHRDVHRVHFTQEGRWIGPGDRSDVGSSREWLWHAFAFLAGNEPDRRLGNAIAAATPNLPNHFNPIAAAQLILTYPDGLDSPAREHLAGFEVQFRMTVSSRET